MADPVMQAATITGALGCCCPACFVGLPAQLHLETITPSFRGTAMAYPRIPVGMLCMFGTALSSSAGAVGCIVGGLGAGVGAGTIVAVAVTAMSVRDMLRRRDMLRKMAQPR
mmetsp:Transcript_40771/g.93860  ORF Transcript_40771/g.93860 Transcript_40771/m.93860 type:complete len:112 (+) Transcript_40771:36-371(+)